MTTKTCEMNTTATRKEYLDAFDSPDEAIAFENAVLSAGREFLPESALKVLDGGRSTGKYWAFLLSQIADSPPLVIKGSASL
jgi:hypothetical protein